MANTFSQIYFHLVFTPTRREYIIPPSFQEELNKYITGIVSGKKQKIIAINGVPDHIHILIQTKPDVRPSGIVRDIKSNSSRFINEKKILKGKFQWQEGYGIFSVSFSQISKVADYVIGQPEHHKKKPFREEYLQLLSKHEIDYDPKYLPDFF